MSFKELASIITKLRVISKELDIASSNLPTSVGGVTAVYCDSKALFNRSKILSSIAEHLETLLPATQINFAAEPQVDSDMKSESKHEPVTCKP